MTVKVYNDSLKLAVIGSPVLHSLSPCIHNAMLSALGLHAVYLAQAVQPDQLKDWVHCAKVFGWGGFNVTMPHKSALVPLMDTLSPAARVHGAVNTVVVRDGLCHGHNTDGQGFLRALVEAGIRPQGKRLVILGAGGAARSVALSLLEHGAASVSVACRSPQAAADLVARAPAIQAIGLDTLPSSLACCDLLINATPLGMHGTGQDFSDLAWIDALPGHAAVCDLIYNPPQTSLLKAAAARGLSTCNGLGMLIHQAILALELFMDQAIPSARVMPAITAALKEQSQLSRHCSVSL